MLHKPWHRGGRWVNWELNDHLAPRRLVCYKRDFFLKVTEHEEKNASVVKLRTLANMMSLEIKSNTYLWRKMQEKVNRKLNMKTIF